MLASYVKAGQLYLSLIAHRKRLPVKMHLSLQCLHLRARVLLITRRCKDKHYFWNFQKKSKLFFNFFKCKSYKFPRNHIVFYIMYAYKTYLIVNKHRVAIPFFLPIMPAAGLSVVMVKAPYKLARNFLIWWTSIRVLLFSAWFLSLSS